MRKGLKHAAVAAVLVVGMWCFPQAVLAAPGDQTQAGPQQTGVLVVSRENGSRMVTADDSTGDVNARAVRGAAWDSYTSDHWNIVTTGGSVVTIENVKSGKCLQPYNGNFTLHQQVVVRSCDGSRTQRWSLTQATDGSYQITPINDPSLALALGLAANDAWTELTLERAWYSTDRLWNFVS